MHHLFLGIDPTELGRRRSRSPSRARCILGASRSASRSSRGARLYMLPCIAGHVGADAAGATLSEGPHRQDEMMLLVDVGTNAEIVLGNRGRVVAASSPTGPAFEGAEISGRPARRARRDRARAHRPRHAGAAITASSASSNGRTSRASHDAARPTGVTGICGSAIIEVVAEMYLAGIISEDGVLDGALAARSPRIVRQRPHLLLPAARRRASASRVTQNDVRAIQLAKAALYAGVKLLMEKQGVATVDTHPLRRCLRLLHRSEIRHGARA